MSKRRLRSRQVLVGFYTDEDGKAKPITKSKQELTRRQIVKKVREFKGIKPSWKRRPIYTIKGGQVHVGIYDKQKGIIDSVPLETYDPKLMSRKSYRGVGRPPHLKGAVTWSCPELTPSKLLQRRHVAEKLSGGTVLELFAGKGNLSKEVWAKKADKLVLVDKNKKFLQQAHRKLKGKVKHETIVANNKIWLRKVMTPEQLKNVRVVDFDAFGSPALQAKRFFERFPIRRPMYVCFTDGSNIFLAFHRKRKTGRKFLKEHYGADFKPEGKRDDQVKALDTLMQQQARLHGFKVEPINLGFGQKQSVYAAYKISPKKRVR